MTCSVLFVWWDLLSIGEHSGLVGNMKDDPSFLFLVVRKMSKNEALRQSKTLLACGGHPRVNGQEEGSMLPQTYNMANQLSILERGVPV